MSSCRAASMCHSLDVPGVDAEPQVGLVPIESHHESSTCLLPAQSTAQWQIAAGWTPAGSNVCLTVPVQAAVAEVSAGS